MMSNYTAAAIHPETGALEPADFLDDHYGRHQYGVRFADGSIWPISAAIIPSREQVTEALDYHGIAPEDVQEQVEVEAARQEAITESWRQERYLGDAVYASFDGYQVWLRTRDGTANVLNSIALPPEVFGALCQYVDAIEIRRGEPL